MLDDRLFRVQMQTFCAGIADFGPVLPSRATVFTELDPPLKGELLWAEAQEHYVRLATSQETRMVQIRFSDMLRDLPGDAGIQVHRPHSAIGNKPPASLMNRSVATLPP